MKSGIYTITNVVNGKLYVGSSVNIAKRFGEHYRALVRGDHCNSYLQNSWNKYGKDSFVFEELEECDDNLLIYIEQYWINMLNSANSVYGYNICSVAGSTLGISCSESTKSKISIKAKKRLSNKENHPMYGKKREPTMLGRKHSEETIEKMRSGSRKIRSEVQRAALKRMLATQVGDRHPRKGSKNPKLAEYNRKFKKNVPSRNRKAVLKYSIDNVLLNEYESLKDAARLNNICSSHICQVCNNKRKTAGGYKWKYKPIKKLDGLLKEIDHTNVYAPYTT